MRNILLLSLIFILTACNFSFAPAPTPTSPTTSTPTLTPTNTLTPTLTSTSTLIPTLTPTSTPVPNGPCDNPLVPLAPGNQWEYRLHSSSSDALFTLKSTGRQDTTYIVTMVEFMDHKKNFTIEEESICQDGAIEKFPLFVLNMLLTEFLQNYLNVFQESGSYAPVYQTLALANWNSEWQIDYLVEDTANIKNPFGGTDLLVMPPSHVMLVAHLDGSYEDITTPAGDFPQALKLFQTYTLPVTITENNRGKSSDLIIYTTQWYEPYVGLVRAQVDLAAINIDGFKFKALIDGTLELTRFIPGQ